MVISKPVNWSWRPEQQIAYTGNVIFAEAHWLFILYSAFLKRKKEVESNKITLDQQRPILQFEILHKIWVWIETIFI